MTNAEHSATAPARLRLARPAGPPGARRPAARNLADDIRTASAGRRDNELLRQEDRRNLHCPRLARDRRRRDRWRGRGPRPSRESADRYPACHARPVGARNRPPAPAARRTRGASLRGHRAVVLQVEDFNARAIDLYRRNGYLEIARRPDREFGSRRHDRSRWPSCSTPDPDDGPGIVRAWRPDDRTRCLALFDGNVPAYFAPKERADFVAFLDDLRGPYLVIEDAAGRCRRLRRLSGRRPRREASSCSAGEWSTASAIAMDLGGSSCKSASI